MLAVKFKEVRSRGEIEKDVLGTEALEPWDKKGLYERFVVTITNTGNVEAFIGDVGVIDEHGRKASALVRRTANDTILTRITNVDGEVIAPKSAKSYIVYHGRDENFIEARKAFVVDQTGLEWKSNHRI